MKIDTEEPGWVDIKKSSAIDACYFLDDDDMKEKTISTIKSKDSKLDVKNDEEYKECYEEYDNGYNGEDSSSNFENDAASDENLDERDYIGRPTEFCTDDIIGRSDDYNSSEIGFQQVDFGFDESDDFVTGSSMDGEW